MNKRTAEIVLAEVKAKFNTDEPRLYDADHEELPAGSWSIAWEGSGMDCWPATFQSKAPGVFTEPIASWCLGVFDA